MSNRLNQERENELAPKRMEYAITQLELLGYVVLRVNDNTLKFIHKGKPIMFYPYSGWASGATITDCRGIDNLLKQLK